MKLGALWLVIAGVALIDVRGRAAKVAGISLMFAGLTLAELPPSLYWLFVAVLALIITVGWLVWLTHRSEEPSAKGQQVGGRGLGAVATPGAEAPCAEQGAAADRPRE